MTLPVRFLLSLVAGLALFAVRSANATSVGMPCDTPISEICSNGTDDDGNGLIDCLDPACSASDGDYVCGSDGRLKFGCMPLLDDPAKIRFKLPKRLDLVTLSGRGIPGVAMNPGVETVDFLVLNGYGTVISQSLLPGDMILNARGNRWKYRNKKNSSPMIYSAVIIEKLNKKTGDLEYTLKFKAETDAWVVDPARNVGPTEDELRNITTQVSVGPYVFFVNALWERVPKNPSSTLKGWKLTDKYMQSL